MEFAKSHAEYGNFMRIMLESNAIRAESIKSEKNLLNFSENLDNIYIYDKMYQKLVQFAAVFDTIFI